MSSPPEDGSFILKLPNEVLAEILSTVIQSAKSPAENRHTYKFSNHPFYSIRSVCRRFRFIVAEFPFWTDPDFNILSLQPLKNRRSEDEENYKTWMFHQDLLKDRYIVSHLQQRTNWRI